MFHTYIDSCMECTTTVAVIIGLICHDKLAQFDYRYWSNVSHYISGRGKVKLIMGAVAFTLLHPDYQNWPNTVTFYVLTFREDNLNAVLLNLLLNNGEIFVAP